MGEGRDRRLGVVSALQRAGLAAARTEDPDALYDSVVESLRDAGFFVSIYVIDGDRARLARSSFGDRAVRVVERHTGLRQDQFSVSLENAQWFRQVMASPEPLLVDTASVLGEIFPATVKWLAGPVARVIRIRTAIGARVLDENHRTTGLLFLLGDDLDSADIATASVFAQLLSETQNRARMTRALRSSVEELRATQAQLLHAQKMEAIGRLSAGLAHDLNNTLTPALFAVEEMTLAKLSEADLRESVATVRQSLERCAELTRAMLAFGRRQMLSRRRIRLDDAVGEALRLVRASFQEHVRLSWTPGAANAHVNIDVTQLHQVLINLALNAREAMPQGGVFTVATRAVGADQVELSCRDTGEGMEPEVMARIFEPFFSARRSGRGSGLGLSVVEGIVQQHGGTIAVESTVGQGSTFRITLTAEAPEQVAPNVEPHATAAGQGQRVLVVEDDELVRRTLSRILRMDGYVVVEADSLATSRAAQTREAPFALIITDVVLSDGNATDETVALARQGQAVLFVTGHPLDGNWLPVESARLPVLQKPFGPKDLLSRVREVLASK